MGVTEERLVYVSNLLDQITEENQKRFFTGLEMLTSFLNSDVKEGK